jgi:hypothetical protein
VARGRPSGRATRGGERIQAPRPARIATAAGAAAAYAGVLADTLGRAGSVAPALAPAAAIGAALLVAALARGETTLGPALWLAAATYVAFLVGVKHGTDAAAPLVAVLLLLCGELSAWSLDERWRIGSDPQLAWRRGVAVAALALAGLAAATLVVALAAEPGGRGLAWTVAGAAAAIGAAGTGVWLARREQPQ